MINDRFYLRGVGEKNVVSLSGFVAAESWPPTFVILVNTCVLLLEAAVPIKLRFLQSRSSSSTFFLHELPQRT
jgi:hypothetical protein